MKSCYFSKEIGLSPPVIVVTRAKQQRFPDPDRVVSVPKPDQSTIAETFSLTLSVVLQKCAQWTFILPIGLDFLIFYRPCNSSINQEKKWRIDKLTDSENNQLEVTNRSPIIGQLVTLPITNKWEKHWLSWSQLNWCQTVNNSNNLFWIECT